MQHMVGGQCTHRSGVKQRPMQGQEVLLKLIRTLIKGNLKKLFLHLKDKMGCNTVNSGSNGNYCKEMETLRERGKITQKTSLGRSPVPFKDSLPCPPPNSSSSVSENVLCAKHQCIPRPAGEALVSKYAMHSKACQRGPSLQNMQCIPRHAGEALV